MINIRVLHEEILVVADHFDAFCRKNNIKYFLLGGTALGAVRHAGFIPWDDDFDVCMDLYNYSKFLKLWKLNPSTKFYLQEENTNEWPLYFSKLRLNGSKYLEAEDQGRIMHNGVYIDIMCLNRLSNILPVRLLQFFAAKLLSAEAIFKRGYTTTSFLKKLFIHGSRLALKIFGKKNLLSFIRFKNHDSSCYYLGHFFGRAPYRKSLIRADLLVDGKLINFSGRKFWVFSDVDEYLKNRFGECYMEMPSEEIKSAYPSHCIEFKPRHNEKL